MLSTFCGPIYSVCLFQVAESQVDNLQPRVEHLLKESKLLANREGARGDHIHQALLELSSRWLKACDEVEKQKKAVRIVPNWYQFRSNMDDIDAWLKKMEQEKESAVEVRSGSALVPRLGSAIKNLPIQVKGRDLIPIRDCSYVASLPNTLV